MSINRRKFIKNGILLPAISLNSFPLFSCSEKPSGSHRQFKRVRPGDPGWPSEESWAQLKKAVNGNLVKLESPLAACKASGDSKACKEVFKGLKNPYNTGDNPALTQSSGWLDAWRSEPSVYAVAVKSTANVVAAINFARHNNLRLVVKGGGHSYQGTSNAADSLLIWTRAMNNIVMHDSFVANGCAGKQAPQPAVTIDAGAMWLHAYNAVSVKAGRYVQGEDAQQLELPGSYWAVALEASPSIMVWLQQHYWKQKLLQQMAQ